MAENAPERKKIISLSRNVFTLTFSDFEEEAQLTLLHESLEAKFETGPLKIGRSLEIGFSVIIKRCKVSVPATFKILFLIELKNPIYSIKMKSSILNSDNEAKHSEYFNAMPKDRKFVRFFHKIDISTLLNDIRLLTYASLTLICEIEIHYKFSFKNLEGISVDYVRSFYASIVCDATNEQNESEKEIQSDRYFKICCAGKEFLIHESSLTWRSEVFLDIIHQASLTETKEIYIEDIDADVLKNILNFTCCDHILYKPLEFIITMFIAANEFTYYDLKRYCSSILSINLSMDNVCKFTQLANKYHDYSLLAAVKKFTNRNLY